MVTEWFKPQNMLKYTHERVSLVAQMVKTPPAMQETQVQSLSQEDPWRRKWQPTPVFLPVKSHGQKTLEGNSPWGLKSQIRLSD